MTIRKFFLFSAVGLFCLFLAGVLVGNSWMQSYLRSPQFCRLVSDSSSSALAVNGEFAPLQWSGWSVYSDEFSGKGNPGAPLAEVTAQRIRTEFRWRSVLEGCWKLENTTVGALQISLQSKKTSQPLSSQSTDKPASPKSLNFSSPPETSPDSLGKKLHSLLPQRFDLGEVTVDSATLHFPGGALKNMEAKITEDGSDWILKTKGGQFLWLNLPKNELQSLQARWNNQEKTFFLTSSSLAFSKGGTLFADGSFSSANDTLDIKTRWDGIPLSELIPKNYHSQISGVFSGHAATAGNPGSIQKWTTTGAFSLSDGSLQNVPILETFATFTNSPQFKRIPLHEVSGDFVYTTQQTQIEKFVLESRGLLKVVGRFSVKADGALSGVFQVGLTQQTLKWLPGSKTQVFVSEHDGYSWTNVRLSGSLDHPKEDLTKRLLGAVGEEMIQIGSKVINQSSDTAIDGAKAIIDKILPLFP